MGAFLLLNGGALIVALVVALGAGLSERTSRLLLGTLCGYLVVVHSIVLLAGLVGHLTVAGLAVLLAGVMAGALWLIRGANHDGEKPGDGARFTAAVLFVLFAAIASGIVWMWPHFFEATRLWIWDDYTYHMVYPALWLREGTIAAATPAHAFTMQAWYPLSASLVATWFMAPFQGSRGDALAWVSLTGPLYAGIIASGAAELLARLGCHRGAWALPVIVLATSHRIVIMAGSFSDADLAQAAALFGAFVFAVPRGDAENHRGVRVDAWYAALLTGFALGVKVSAAVPALIILLMLTLRAVKLSETTRARLSAGIRTMLVFAVSWAATGGFWYTRNIIHTGNPVYPAAFLIWPGATFLETTLREYSRQYGLRRAVADALVVYMNWPLLHATVAVIGLIALAGWLVFRRQSLTRSRLYFSFGTLAIATAVLILLPVAPYSAGNAMTFRSGFVHWDSMRYVALLPILGWSALGFLLDAGAGARHWRTIGAVLIGAASLMTSESALLSSPIVLVALALCAAGLTRVRLRTNAWPCITVRGEALAASAAAVGIAGIVIVAHSAKAAATTAAFYREPLFGAAAAVLDREPAGTRVAVFGDQWVYPAFGIRDHLVPVRLDRDGRVATAPIAEAMEPGDLTVDSSTFRSNLRTSGVGVVVVVHLPHPGRSADWPTQHAALGGLRDAQLLHRDGGVAVWRLSSEGAGLSATCGAPVRPRTRASVPARSGAGIGSRRDC